MESKSSLVKGNLCVKYEPDWAKGQRGEKICYGQVITDGQSDHYRAPAERSLNYPFLSRITSIQTLLYESNNFTFLYNYKYLF